MQGDLSGAYNRIGIVTDGTAFSTGGLDGDGNALSANLLGSTVAGFVLLGAPNTANAVPASGQTVAFVPGEYALLNFLAAGVNGSRPNRQFVVTYTDGTAQTFTQSFSDWAAPQGFGGESIAVTMPYRNQADGTTSLTNSPPGGPYYLYQYSFRLTSGKQIASVTLPDDQDLQIISLSLTGETV